MRPKFHSVPLYDEPFLSYRPFWEKCTKWSQYDLKPYKVKCTSCMCYKYPWGPNFTLSLYDEPILSYRPFWEKCTKWHQNDLQHFELKCSPYVLIVSLVPKCHPVLLYDSRFWDIGHFERSAQNDPKMTLNPTNSNVLHIFITIVPESQVSLRFALRPAFFNVQAILRQVHQMTPKWHWTLQGQGYPIMCY